MLGTKNIYHQTLPYLHDAVLNWDGFVETPAKVKADNIEVGTVSIDHATVVKDLKDFQPWAEKENKPTGIPKEALTPEDQMLLDELLAIRAAKSEAIAVRTIRGYAQGILAEGKDIFGPHKIGLQDAIPFSPPIMGRAHRADVDTGPYAEAIDDTQIRFTPSPYRLIGKGTAVYTLARYALTLGEDRLEKFEAIVSEIPRSGNDELCLDYKTIVVEHDLAIGSIHKLAEECRQATQKLQPTSLPPESWY